MQLNIVMIRDNMKVLKIWKAITVLSDQIQLHSVLSPLYAVLLSLCYVLWYLYAVL